MEFVKSSEIPFTPKGNRHDSALTNRNRFGLLCDYSNTEGHFEARPRRLSNHYLNETLGQPLRGGFFEVFRKSQLLNSRYIPEVPRGWSVEFCPLSDVSLINFVPGRVPMEIDR